MEVGEPGLHKRVREVKNYKIMEGVCLATGNLSVLDNGGLSSLGLPQIGGGGLGGGNGGCFQVLAGRSSKFFWQC